MKNPHFHNNLRALAIILSVLVINQVNAYHFAITYSLATSFTSKGDYISSMMGRYLILPKNYDGLQP